MTYDLLQRPTGLYISDNGAPEFLAEKTEYGESKVDHPELTNHRGKVWKISDGAGIVTSEAYDFKGNLLSSSRVLLRNYREQVNWLNAPAREDETFSSRTRYDALNGRFSKSRPIATAPAPSSIFFNRCTTRRICSTALTLGWNRKKNHRACRPPIWRTFGRCENIDYNAKGQRERIRYGNAAETEYRYDRETFRLVRLHTRRNAAAFPDDCPEPPPTDWPGCDVQNCTIRATRRATSPISAMMRSRPSISKTSASSPAPSISTMPSTADRSHRREHLGQTGGALNAPTPHSHNDAPRVGLLHPGDGRAMGLYLERYVYDAVGNFLEMQHRGSDPAHPGWTRTYDYDEASLVEPTKKSNRFSRTA